ncbi:serine/threonine protein kinase Hsk1 [Metarhizium album ARSEF 1941]|uniref:non-specific serine/threonine protein kinase n=1 Tax=Metarhizium album (strain ARSEF 1941) TaxID=1081103 RepID=A0A0B2WN17_METAS|nr:serine/threonine protein kinase Hsk1 [Metarhizium album ARSEF 1941]KHN97461.1 serine/threonine protein kinase Hsk1 [Metarhizium album ARSEF 1941]
MAATLARRRAEDPFDIHEDARTEETEMMVEEDVAGAAATDELMEEDVEEEENEEENESSDDECVERGVQADMEKLASDFPGFRGKYRLIKRIGEGTFSTVYKAEDVQYDRYDNSWDFDDDSSKWTPPPLKRHASHASSMSERSQRRRTRFVAVKKIYVTSSPARILNELELLHDLRQCPSVCPLITAFRNTDQVVAILPYFRHGDFRAYFRDMTTPDVAIYLRSLFTALKSVHQAKILHRDIKPTNFLYDPATQHGVLVDFGLAEREGSDCKPCLCHEHRETRRHRQSTSAWAQMATTSQPGYPTSDTRLSKRANRAGTRGFRAPEVLFKCTEQTTSIDIWSAGVILLTILSKRFPFFNSADDVEAMIEIATIFGSKRMKAAGLLHGCVFETNIPTIGQQGFTMEKIILWSTCRTSDKPLTPDEKLAVRFLERCMDLDPSRRITAEQALDHEFLSIDQPQSQELGDEDEVDMLAA